MLSLYARLIVRHSYLFLFILSVISTVLTVIPMVCHDLPSFSEPLIGFETRGTTLAHRFIAWENLIYETRPSRKLAVNPKEIEDQIRMNQTYYNKTRQDKPRSGHGRAGKNKNRKKKKKPKLNSTGFEKTIFDSPDINISNGHVHWGFGKNMSHESENTVINRDHIRKQWVSLKEMQLKPEKPIHHNYASGTCGAPVFDYAHLVVTSTDDSSLLTYPNIARMCKLQTFLIEAGEDEYYKVCERAKHTDKLCCPIWSVPNYIALISDKSSCENLTEVDVNKTVSILKNCAGYFHNFTLMASCDLDRCKVPKYCSQHDAIYNMLFYLIDSDAFSPLDFTQTFVKSSMIFLPLPYSSTTLPYYEKLQSSNLSYENIIIPAIDFGLKNALFDLWIVQDAWLIALGGIFVFVGVWFYSKSLILTLLLFTAITYSLGIAYFLYVYVFNLEFFPFMNLLVVVIVIGIGADDAFIYVKIWSMITKQLIKDNIASEENCLTDIKNVSSAGETILVQILEETLKHSIATIFITTLTTAIAFFASYVSYIPAINCFSVFAGTAVLVNFFLMVSWLPVSVFIIDVKLSINKGKFFDIVYKTVNEVWEDIRVCMSRFIIVCVTKLHIVFVIVLGAIGIYSIIVVFYYPGLQLPDSKEFQLFQHSHPFELYDIEYRDKFIFEKFGRYIGTGSKMPLRWIWGVKAIDNGNHMNPFSTGHLVFDDRFSVSDPKSQQWLLEFCSKIKAQPFYQQTLGPLLPNCFIESFKVFMSRRCMDFVDKINRSPCCESSSFPYKKEVFDTCIIEAMESLYQTPSTLFMPGVAGPKFFRTESPTIAAIVVEFESVVPYTMSYKTMHNFFQHVENWTQHELKSAPPGMTCGWFLSDLQFYDLQTTLASGTVIALILSASLGFVVLIPATFSFIVSICALTAIVFSSTVTIAVLVMSGWKLNILESVAISTSAGLAVDFSLHYALSYTNSSGLKLARVKYALTSSAGPTAAAALTTCFAGIFLLRSNLLPYSQIGTFLALIMTFSWVYATFFLCSMLYICGQNNPKEPPVEDRKSVSRVSSICSGVPNLESHELEHLADSNRTNLTHSQSHSSISATTVVLHDDYENPHSKVDKKASNSSNLVCYND
ncbi:protein dispatched homolog 1 [Plodia interpunctella]|uniref:protein dispatched homolog 1 n=1 Tax=Plodia interpunctella TaxID=58824 RepID=UPI002368704F|nr:protein dispatched homolog 1 [Plodia interpunctella]